MLAGYLQSRLNQTFVVENKPGASGSIGAAYVARAKPDGYTLLVTTSTTHSTIEALLKSVPYDPIKDFTPILRFAAFPVMLVVNPSLPIKSIQDYIGYARANPGKLDFGYAMSSGQIAGEAVRRHANIDLVRIAYRTVPQAIADVMAGHAKSMVVDMGTGTPQVRAGKLRPIALASRERSTILPDVPTLSETILPGFDVTAWAGMFAPANTPPEVAATIAPEIETFLKQPEMREYLSKSGVEVAWTGPDQFLDFVKAERTRWMSLAKEAGIEPQ
jgi:tripartite-type tricarboxylate transporter receptor subunit TctC